MFDVFYFELVYNTTNRPIYNSVIPLGTHFRLDIPYFYIVYNV